MKIDNESFFCPGCPNAGNYVGPVEVDNINVALRQKDGTVVRSALMGGNIVGVAFTDQDGIASNEVTRSYDVHSEDKEIIETKAATIVERIGKCVGRHSVIRMDRGDGREIISCPALNSEVVKALLNKA